MYLSRLRLNPTDPNARRDLADAYEMHRTLARVYVPDAEQPPMRFLWRQERNASGWPDGTVLVQSAEAGRWQVLQQTPEYLQTLEADKVVDLNALVQSGRRYRFRLLANPTVTRAGKRHGLTKEGDQVAWLHRQGQNHGFEVLSALRGASQRLDARHRGRQRITVHGVLFEGILQSTDENRLRSALTQGLGHAKSLGLGMLSLAAIAT